MLYSIRETDAEANISTDSCTKQLNKKKYSNSLPRQQQNIDTEILKLNSIISQLKQVEQMLINQVNDLKSKLDEQYRNQNKQQQYIDDLNKELKLYQDKLHCEQMQHGQQQKNNIELRKSVLKLESDLLQQNKINQDINDELQILKYQITVKIRSQHNHEHKFIESLLHMVISCHPDNSFREQPSLKQAWKWLKLILSDYMTLKQQSRNFQDNSGQSSSSTNK